MCIVPYLRRFFSIIPTDWTLLLLSLVMDIFQLPFQRTFIHSVSFSSPWKYDPYVQHQLGFAFGFQLRSPNRASSRSEGRCRVRTDPWPLLCQVWIPQPKSRCPVFCLLPVLPSTLYRFQYSLHSFKPRSDNGSPLFIIMRVVLNFFFIYLYLHIYQLNCSFINICSKNSVWVICFLFGSWLM